MTRWRSPGGHRRTVKKSEGDPRRVRQTKQRAALAAEACTWPRCSPGCPECDPDA